VLAFQGYVHVRRLGAVQPSRWWELLDYLAGLLEPRPTPELPAGLTPPAVQVGNAIRLLVGLRDRNLWPPDVPFMLERGFVAALANVHRGTHPRLGKLAAYHAIRELAAVGFLRHVGEHGRAKLWVLKGVTPPVGRRNGQPGRGGP
jgi:hypothetical protein